MARKEIKDYIFLAILLCCFAYLLWFYRSKIYGNTIIFIFYVSAGVTVITWGLEFIERRWGKSYRNLATLGVIAIIWLSLGLWVSLTNPGDGSIIPKDAGAL